MPNYKKGKIYKIINDINDKKYYGSTISTLSHRFCQHKTNMNNEENLCLLYEEMRELGKEHFKIILIENYEAKNKDDLRAREQFFLDRDKPELNKIKAFRTEDEKIEYNRKYDKKRRETKILCICGIMSDLTHISRHKKTIRHLKRIELIDNKELEIIETNETIISFWEVDIDI